MKISWALADARYKREKVAAYDKCEQIGIDLQNHIIRLRYDLGRTLRETFRILGDLLQQHMRLDVEQVLEGAGRMAPSYAHDVASRMQSEFFDILDDLRQSMINHGLDGLTVESLLDPLKHRADAIHRSAILPGLVS